jgi:hypothetical protein
MCLGFKFCTHHRVCVLNFLLKSQIRCTLLYSFAGDLYFFKLTQPLTLSVKKKGEKPDRNPYPLPYGLRTETSSQRTLKIMSRNRNVIVRSWIRLLYKSYNMCRLVHCERDTVQMFLFLYDWRRGTPTGARGSLTGAAPLTWPASGSRSPSPSTSCPSSPSCR